MQSVPIVGNAAVSKVLLIGQAPGPHEFDAGRPWGWTAGKTLFQWFSRIGFSETYIRERWFISAVCRCFPGKMPKGGGDRVPTTEEIGACSKWLNFELDSLRPELVIPVGRLAISRFLPAAALADVVGIEHSHPLYPAATIIPLPHPSGVSAWHKVSPGRDLLDSALSLIQRHPASSAKQ